MTTAPPRVSIIITSYNQRDYLIEAIESALSQTMRPHEIIVADDHSTLDDSVEVIKGYIARHPGWIKGVFQPKNVRVPTNRHSALRQIEGDYVAILDGDDRLLPKFLETQMALLAKHPEAGCSYSNIYRINPQGERYEIREHMPLPSGDIFRTVAAGQMGILRSMIARYDLIKAVGLTDAKFLHYDGFILSLRLAALTRFVYVLDPLVEKREHPRGVAKNMSRREKVSDLEIVYLEVLKLSSHLSASDLDQLKDAWYWKLLAPRVLAEIEGGQKMQAMVQLVKGLARNPRRIRKLWGLALQVMA